MKLTCQFCNKTFITNTVLKHHQKTAKYCLKLQGKGDIEGEFKCEGCNKTFTRKDFYSYHINICKKIKIDQHERKIEEIKEQCERKDKIILSLKKQLKSQKNEKEKNFIELKQDYKELLDSYQRLAELYVMDGKNKIEALNKKFLKKRGRTKYECQNVIYILTTPGLKKERRYILGKATNLTNRLSTYNKTDEHEVVFYSSCPNKEKMSVVEGMVFNKLELYREQANRERFILPDDKEINLFSETIKKCIDFIK